MQMLIGVRVIIVFLIMWFEIRKIIKKHRKKKEVSPDEK